MEKPFEHRAFLSGWESLGIVIPSFAKEGFTIPLLPDSDSLSPRFPDFPKPHVHTARDRITSSATSLVPSLPPMSAVVLSARTHWLTARSIASAGSLKPRWSSIIAPVRIDPIGFATFFPAIGGDEP